MHQDLSRRIDELHGPWQLPFLFLDLTPELGRPDYAVVADDGTVFRANGRPGLAEREVEAAGRVPGRRFAWAVVARVEGTEHVLSTCAFAEQPARAWLRQQAGERACWVLRAERREPEVELLPVRGPEPVEPRVVLDGPVDLLCDLGMVLCRFDRSAFGRHFEAVFGFEVPAAGREWIDAHRLAFEAGEIEEAAFAAELMPKLNLAAPDRATVERLWGSIFTPKRSTLAALRGLAARDGVELVVVSNTDPWALRACRERFGLEDLLFGVAASYQPGVRPKGEDASLWLKARETATARRGSRAPFAVAIDDVRTYLFQALQSGAADAAVHYRDFASFRFELASLGL